MKSGELYSVTASYKQGNVIAYSDAPLTTNFLNQGDLVVLIEQRDDMTDSDSFWERWDVLTKNGIGIIFTNDIMNLCDKVQ